MYVCTESASNAGINVNAQLSEKYRITNLGPAWQSFSNEILRDYYGISLAQNTFNTTILKRFHMYDAHAVTTPMDSNVKLNFTDDWGKKKLDRESVKHYHAFIGLLIYAAHAMQPDISYTVTALFRYISCRFTSHMTSALRVLQYPKATTEF
jgi:hypothetical protein